MVSPRSFSRRSCIAGRMLSKGPYALRENNKMQKHQKTVAKRKLIGILPKGIRRWLYAPTYAKGYRIYFR